MKGQAHHPALFDTDVLIWYFRGARKAYDLISQTPYDLRWVSSVSVMELIQGCRNKPEMKMVVSFIKENISRVIHFDERISAKAISLLQAYALSHGLRTTDAIIASSAINNKAALITANHRHFTMIKALNVIKYRA